MLHLEFTTQDSASLHQLLIVHHLVGRLDDLGNFEGCSSDMGVGLPTQYKGGGVSSSTRRHPEEECQGRSRKKVHTDTYILR